VALIRYCLVLRISAKTSLMISKSRIWSMKQSEGCGRHYVTALGCNNCSCVQGMYGLTWMSVGGHSVQSKTQLLHAVYSVIHHFHGYTSQLSNDNCRTSHKSVGKFKWVHFSSHVCFLENKIEELFLACRHISTNHSVQGDLKSLLLDGTGYHSYVSFVLTIHV
jgi:hypothetical protein